MDQLSARAILYRHRPVIRGQSQAAISTAIHHMNRAMLPSCHVNGRARNTRIVTALMAACSSSVTVIIDREPCVACAE